MKKLLGIALAFLTFSVQAQTPVRGAKIVLTSSSGCTVVTPAAPTLTADNNANTISASHALGNSEIVYYEGGAGPFQYTGTIVVGNMNRPSGYYQFRTKAAPCRNASNLVASPAFTYVNNSQAAGYSPYLIAYLAKAGMTDTTEVLYTGTAQQHTVQYIKDSLNPLFKYMDRQGFFTVNKFRLFAPMIGGTQAANLINAVDTSLANMTVPGGITVTSFGLKGNGLTQSIVTGISPYPNLYNNGSGDISTYTDDSTSGYFSIYTGGAGAVLRSYTNSGSSIRVESGGSIFDFGGENATNARLLAPAGTTRQFLQGNRTDKSHSSFRNFSTVLGTTTTPLGGGTYFPSAPFEIGLASTVPQCFAFVYNKGLSDAQLDSMAVYVERATRALGRDAVPPSQYAPPTNPFVNNAAKLFQFTSVGDYRYDDFTNYSVSLDSGATWTKLNSSIALRETTPYSAPTPNVLVYVGNFSYPSGKIQVRKDAAANNNASEALLSNAPYTYDAAFSANKPTGLYYEASAGLDGANNNQYYQTLDWTSPIGINRYYRYQVTQDGGTTWETAPSKPWYVGNVSKSANQLGVRTVDTAGNPSSSWAFLPNAITADPITTVNVTGLVQMDSLVTATVTSGSTVIVLSNKLHHQKVGDRLIIDNNSVAGHGARGTKALDSWPIYAEETKAAALANAASYVPNQYLTIWADTGYVYRWNGAKTDLNRYNGGHPDRNKSISRPLEVYIRQILTPDSLTVLVDKAPKISASGAYVYFDQSPALRAVAASVTNHTVINVPAGKYAVGTRIEFPRKYDITWNARNVTLCSPPGARSVSFTTEGCNGFKINTASGTGVFKVLGNYTYNTMGFGWPGDSTVNGDQRYPSLDEAFTNNVTVLNPGMGLWASYTRINNIEAQDNPHANLQNNSGIDCRWTGVKVVKSEIIALPDLSGTPSYFGSYYWSVNWENAVGGYIDGYVFTSPKWINAMEPFNSRGVTFKNFDITNGYASMNGCAKTTFKNGVFHLQAGSRTFQNTGHSLCENNVFEKNHDWDEKNRCDSVRVFIEGSIVPGVPNIYPLGFWDRGGQTFRGGYKTTAGMEYINCEYHRPDITASSPWPGQGVRVSAEGGYVDHFTATGDFYSPDIAGGVQYFGGAAIAVGGGDPCNPDIRPVIKNSVAPTFSYPANAITLNNTATQGIVTAAMTVCAGNDTTINGTSFAFQPLVYAPSSQPVSSIEWIFKNAYLPDGVTQVYYNGTSTDNITIPASFPQSISLTTQTGLRMPTGANVYLYSDGSGKQITGKVTSYNASTGALVVNATTADGATGSFNDAEVISEPVITNIYAQNATVSGLTAGIYVYQLKVINSVGTVVRDNMAITKQ